MEERLSAAGGELLAEVRNSVASVWLNRPEALNALTFGMLEGLTRWLDGWEQDERVRKVVLHGSGPKAFCAGGDVRALYESIKSGTSLHRDFFVVEYTLDYRIHNYPKTTAAQMNGIVMGGGMGLAQGTDIRIVGGQTRMAMPETAIGLFPDVGGSYFLSRLPGKLGLYLGLVGKTIDAAEAVYCGLADVALPGVAKEGYPALWTHRERIDHHFAGDGVPAIIESLRGETDPAGQAWAKETLDALAKRSPTMLCVTFEQLRRARTLSLADCFRMELNLMESSIAHGDMVEGIRALLVDKDNQPRWNPPRLEDVRPADIESFFAPRWSRDQHPLAALA